MNEHCQIRFYRRDGTPYTGRDPLQEWAKDFERAENKRIALTRLPNGYDVSTVWLGLNHAWGDGPPLIYESMVFKRVEKHPWRGLDRQRYSTLHDADQGHQALVEKWQKRKR